MTDAAVPPCHSGSLALAAALSLGAGAYAAVRGSTPSGTATITVCVHHRGGGLFIGHPCAVGDTTLHWDVTGSHGVLSANNPSGIEHVMGALGGELSPDSASSGDTIARGTWAVTAPEQGQT